MLIKFVAKKCHQISTILLHGVLDWKKWRCQQKLVRRRLRVSSSVSIHWGHTLIQTVNNLFIGDRYYRITPPTFWFRMEDWCLSWSPFVLIFHYLFQSLLINIDFHSASVLKKDQTHKLCFHLP